MGMQNNSLNDCKEFVSIHLAGCGKDMHNMKYHRLVIVILILVSLGCSLPERENDIRPLPG